MDDARARDRVAVELSDAQETLRQAQEKVVEAAEERNRLVLEAIFLGVPQGTIGLICRLNPSRISAIVKARSRVREGR